MVNIGRHLNGSLSRWGVPERCQPDGSGPQDRLQALVDGADHWTLGRLVSDGQAPPVGTPQPIGLRGQLEPAAVGQLRQMQDSAGGKRVIGAQDHPDRVRAQHDRADAGLVEGSPGQGDVDQAAS